MEFVPRLLLARWGIAFRDVPHREFFLPRRSEVLIALRGVEAHGKHRGSRFSEAIRGEQFALPEALDLLRAFRWQKDPPATLEIGAASSMNLTGVVLPCPRRGADAGDRLCLGAGTLVKADDRSVLRRIAGNTGFPPKA